MPGPLLRTAVGQRTLIDIYNETDLPERIHWHGQNIVTSEPHDLPPYSMRRVELTPARAGLYFYHSSRVAGTRLESGLYSGQAGVLLVEQERAMAMEDAGSASRAGDLESVVVLKGCESYLYRTARGYEVGDRSVTVNGRLPDQRASLPFGSGRPVLLHVLNAGATHSHTLELPGHSFEVVALDGQPVPTPAKVTRLYLSPGERVTARITPQRPAAWVVQSAATEAWDYTQFGCALQSTHSETADTVFDLLLSRHEAARSGFNCWSVNGVSFCATRPRTLFHLRHGLRYQLRIRNTSDAIIPIHLQRHLLEIVKVGRTPTRGVLKDVVTVKPYQDVEVEFVADNPGRAFLYCSRQLQRDFGLMALVDYV